MAQRLEKESAEAAQRLEKERAEAAQRLIPKNVGNGNSSSLHEMYHIRGHTESHPLCQNNLLTSTAVEIRMGAKNRVVSFVPRDDG